MKKQIVLVADDFGMDAKINEAILHAHVAGGLHAAALMMAQPGTEEAVAMARAHPRLQIGWHLHLNDSCPATMARWPWVLHLSRLGLASVSPDVHGKLCAGKLFDNGTIP